MRTAANILSSAPAMQIRYLDTMQNMAKSANSKVIFLPSAPSQNIQESINTAEAAGEGPSQYGLDPNVTGGAGNSGGEQNPFDPSSSSFQQAMNARVVENI